MYNDEASKYRVLSHNTAMINYYGCVLIQQIFGLYRVPVYSFLEYLPCFQEIFRYIDRRQKFSKRNEYLLNSIEQFFLHLHKKKNDKEFKTSLSLYHRMKWKCLTVKREKNNVKSRNGKSQDTLFLEKRILFHSFFQTLNWRSVSPSKRRPSCKAFSSRNARE